MYSANDDIPARTLFDIAGAQRSMDCLEIRMATRHSPVNDYASLVRQILSALSPRMASTPPATELLSPSAVEDCQGSLPMRKKPPRHFEVAAIG